MPRKRKTAAMPENFEDFAAQVESKPAAKLIGGMVEKKWSGVPMWQCPRCGGTTFKASEAKVHTCKVPKMADEAEE
jgi:hypothetical protein